MKKAVVVYLALAIAVTLIFLAHDIWKEHQSFRESIAEAAIAGVAAAAVFGTVGIILVRRKKRQ